MGNTINRQNKRQLSMDERKLLRNVWAGIGDNPQYHGNVFFLEFCKSYPQYTKYFTLDPEMPLTIDVHITMHFSIIMETMGYLMVDYYHNRKQHDYFIGYVAMVHKDMNLNRRDMSHFAVALIEYLTVTFPTIMTPDNRIIVSAYISNICEDISKNIEDLKTTRTSDHMKLARRKTSLFVRWISCHENSVYGKTIDFWTRRKLVWETRLEEWKRRTQMTGESRKKLSSTDDDVTSTQSLNAENDTSQSTQPSKIYDSSKTSSQVLTLDNAETIRRKPSVMLRTKKSGQTHYDIVKTRDHSNKKIGENSESEFSSQDKTSSSSDSYHEISIVSLLQPMKNMKIDSIARQRRRQRHSV